MVKSALVLSCVYACTTCTACCSYTLSAPVWSCAVNSEDANYIYAGQVNGQVSVFDMRNTTEAVHSIASGSRSPVLALHYLPKNNRTAESA